MSYYDNQYDNLYPLHPPYIEADTANDMNPTIKKQHFYQSAPPRQTSTDSYLQHPNTISRVNTFSMERMIYDMNRQINYIFYICILLVFLVAVVVMCSVITVVSCSINGKRS
jgi:hypothetical protein